MSQNLSVPAVGLRAALLSAALVLLACENTQMFYPYQDSDQDPTPELDLTECALPSSCTKNDDCRVCGDNSLQCCVGVCAATCDADGDGETEIPEGEIIDVEQCNALGKPCSIALDCPVYCRNDPLEYGCLDDLCILATDIPDGDAGEEESTEEESADESEDVADGVDATDTAEEGQDIDPACYTGLPNRAPQLEYLPNVTATAGDMVKFAVPASDPDPCDTLTYLCTDCPAAARFDLTLAPPWFMWQTTDADEGTHHIEIGVRDDGAPAKESSTVLTITLEPAVVNDPPVVDPIADRWLRLGDALTFYVKVSDPENDVLLTEAAAYGVDATFIMQGNSQVKIQIEGRSDSVVGDHPIEFFVKDILGNKTPAAFTLHLMPSSAGATCGTAIPLLVGDIYRGDTSGRSNSLTSGVPCIERKQEGGELLFSVAQPAATGALATVTPVSGDLSVRAINSTCAVCITGNDLNTGTGVERIVLNPDDAGARNVVIVVDSNNSDSAGRFTLVYGPTDLRVTEAALCDVCTDELECGYHGVCAQFKSSSTVLETACTRNCTNNNDCPRGFQCADTPTISGDRSPKQCRPDYYNQIGGHDVETCGAYRELGLACDTGNNEANCGADDIKTVDDANCYAGSGSSGVCTYLCASDDQCPEGYSCRQSGLSRYCLK